MRPLLAAPTDGRGLRFPLLASPKLDGVRCLVIDGDAMSRRLKPIPNAYVRQVLSSAPFNGLDGELVVGPACAPDAYRRTVSAVMSREGCPAFRFVVFDSHRLPGGFRQRLAQLPTLGLPHGQVLQHVEVVSPAALARLEARYLKQGYEGVMLRSPDGPYKQGRSTLREGYLLKLKRFADAEARVIGWAEQRHNANPAKRDPQGYTKRSAHQANKHRTGLLGALLVEDLATGTKFEVGAGFSALERRRLWARRSTLVGRLAKYRHQPHGAHERPRFPVFIGWRDERDI